jgi:hypothetical protein
MILVWQPRELHAILLVDATKVQILLDKYSTDARADTDENITLLVTGQLI